MLALSSYIEAAMERASYEKLEDNTYGGEIPALEGVIAFGPTLRQCERELRSTLEDWILVGFHLGHTLPVLAGIDLNKPAHAHVESVQTT
jgi:predicted RNase H-like HicB family nuclease